MPKTRHYHTRSTSKPDQPSTSKLDTDRSEAKTPETADLAAKTPEPERPESPDNCSICLSGVENKSFTDSCLHTFCYVCLLEWSKVKAVCPLCKQPFKKIIYNVRSLDDFDEYVIPPPPPPRDHLWENFNSSNYGMRFRYRTTLTQDRLLLYQSRHQRTANYGRSLGAPMSRPVSREEARRRRLQQAAQNRRRIYDYDMWVQPVSPTSLLDPDYDSRYRETSPAFFSENEACRYALIPWISRELNILLNGHEDNIHFVLELVLDLIQRFEIRSEEFYELVHPLVGRHARHFIHEFYHFARSPYDLHTYDQRATYQNRPELPATTTGNNNESEDDDVMVVDDDDDEAPNTLTEMVSRSSGVPLSNIGPINVEWNISSTLGDVRTFLQNVMGTATGYGQVSSGAAQMARIHSHHNYAGHRSGASSVNNEPIDLSAGAAAPALNVDVDSDDDVIFVKSEKPYAERSPIVLSSGSDGETVEREGRRRSSSSRARHRRHGDESHRRHGDESHRRHGDESHRRHGDQDGHRRHGDQDGHRRHGDQDGHRRHVDQDCHRRHGDKASHRRHGNQDSHRRHGDEDGHRRHEDQDIHRRHGDEDKRQRKSRSRSNDRIRNERTERTDGHRTSRERRSGSREKRSRSRDRHLQSREDRSKSGNYNISRSFNSRSGSNEQPPTSERSGADRPRSRSRSRSRTLRPSHGSREWRKRDSSTDSVEITRVKRKKAKKHKRNKKHKKHHKRRRVSPDREQNKQEADEPGTSGESRKYKKHPTGHKSSKRSNSEEAYTPRMLASVVFVPAPVTTVPEPGLSSGFESGDFSGDSPIDVTTVSDDVTSSRNEVTSGDSDSRTVVVGESAADVARVIVDELVTAAVFGDSKPSKPDPVHQPLNYVTNVALIDHAPLALNLPASPLKHTTEKLPSIFDEFRLKNGLTVPDKTTTPPRVTTSTGVDYSAKTTTSTGVDYSTKTTTSSAKHTTSTGVDYSAKNTTSSAKTTTPPRVTTSTGVDYSAKTTTSTGVDYDSDCIMNADDDVVFEGECRCRAAQKCAKCLHSSDSSSSDSDSSDSVTSLPAKSRTYLPNTSLPDVSCFVTIGNLISNLGDGSHGNKPNGRHGNHSRAPVEIESDDDGSSTIDVENSEPEIDVETVAEGTHGSHGDTDGARSHGDTDGARSHGDTDAEETRSHGDTDAEGTRSHGDTDAEGTRSHGDTDAEGTQSDETDAEGTQSDETDAERRSLTPDEVDQDYSVLDRRGSSRDTPRGLSRDTPRGLSRDTPRGLSRDTPIVDVESLDNVISEPRRSRSYSSTFNDSTLTSTFNDSTLTSTFNDSPHSSTFSRSRRVIDIDTVDINYRSRDNNHRSRDINYRSRDNNHQSRDINYRSRDNNHQSRDNNHQSRDINYRSRENHHSRDNNHQSRDINYRSRDNHHSRDQSVLSSSSLSSSSKIFTTLENCRRDSSSASEEIDILSTSPGGAEDLSIARSTSMHSPSIARSTSMHSPSIARSTSMHSPSIARSTSMHSPKSPQFDIDIESLLEPSSLSVSSLVTMETETSADLVL